MKDTADRITRARRAGRVRRYHCYDLLVQEDVAQHTFNVMNILMVMNGGVLSPELLVAALLHDQGEYVTGDIPSPVKRMADVTKLNDMEEAAVCMIHVQGTPPLSDWQKLLLKTADNLDGLMKCIEECERHNHQMCEVGNTYATYLTEMCPKLGGGPAGELVRFYLNKWSEMQ